MKEIINLKSKEENHKNKKGFHFFPIFRLCYISTLYHNLIYVCMLLLHAYYIFGHDVDMCSILVQ